MAMNTPDVAIVMGTYNRLDCLKRAVDSIRLAVGDLEYICAIADGESTDGSRDWLSEQSDCELLEGGLGGAVKAFNVGFGFALDCDPEYICTFNDDDEFLDKPISEPLYTAVEILENRPDYGGVAFEMNTRGPWQCEKWAGQPYGNICVTRRHVGEAIARAQGDPTGRAWWDQRFATYAADTIFGIWMHKLGWYMYEGTGLRVQDHSHPDEMHERNVRGYVGDGTSKIFLDEFGTFDKCQYSREDAERFGGVIR